MIECREQPTVDPICPHCEKKITTLWYRQLQGFFGKRYAYICQHCRALLGVSHRKGFFMG